MDVILCLHSSPPTIKVKAKFLFLGKAIKVLGFMYTKTYTRLKIERFIRKSYQEYLTCD
jgi:hypothetical protein